MSDSKADFGAEATANVVATVASHAVGIPSPVAVSALKAINRLVAGIAEVPAAMLRRKVTEIDDRTNTRSLLIRSLGQAAVEKAVTDEVLVSRTLDRLLTESEQRQKNRESIAALCLDDLRANPPPSDAVAPPEDVDADWMNVFVRYAEDASTERARELWAKVLSGQIRGQTCFSLSTLRFLAELDANIAQAFEDIAPSICGEFIIKTPGINTSADFDKFLKLDDAGIINGVIGNLSRIYPVPIGEKAMRVVFNEYSLSVNFEGGGDKYISCYNLTKIGIELSTLLPRSDDVANLRRLYEAFAKDYPIEGAAIWKRTSSNRTDAWELVEAIKG